MSGTQGGFALVEVVVVLSISAIIAGMSVPSLVPFYKSYKNTERQITADLIYTTGQYNMAQLKAQGHLASNVSGAVTLASALSATKQAADDARAPCIDRG